MKNFIEAGNSIQVTAPSGGYTGGQIVKIDQFIGVAVHDAAEYELCTVNLSGVYEIAKEAPLAISAGNNVYWVAANSNVNKTASGNTYAGKAFADAASSDTTVLVRLDN